jgi:ABC-2 type transport system ATP-binding protein
VLTTHYLEEAEALADRVAVIDKGMLVGLDTPAGLVRQLGRRQVRFKLSAPFRGGEDALPEALRRRGATLDTSAQTVICPVDSAPIGELLALAAALSPGVADVEIVQPTLEDVFLQLTKRPDAAAFIRKTS